MGNMVNRLLQLSPLALLALSACAVPLPGKSSRFSWASTRALIAFGDSYTYVQGTRGYVNSTFIGSQLDLSYTPQELLTDVIVQNQTATAEGGPNWVEYLTGCGLEPGYTSPLECEPQLWDFAFGGADISVDFTPLHHNWTINLENQVTQFIGYGNPVLGRFLDKKKTLVAIWIGINDISDSAKYVVNFPTFYNTLQDRLFSLVSSLYALGYPNFLLFNLPPLNRRPGLVNSANPLPNATMINWWDDALANHSSLFAQQNPDTNVMLFDAHAVLSGMLDEPAKYGFVNTTDYCAAYNQPDILTDPEKYGCLLQNEYFWFNSGHMTSHVHKILAGALEDFLQKESRG